MRYPSKAAWAAAKAAELEAKASAIPQALRGDGYSARRYAQGMEAQARLWREAARFRRMAERFGACGK